MKNKILNLILVGLLLISAVSVFAKSNESNNSYRRDSSVVRSSQITPAINSATNECRDFPTLGDVPNGWEVLNIFGSCRGVDESYIKNYMNRLMEDRGICIQVITPAINSATNECRDFPTPCDVPNGWKKVRSCDVVDINRTNRTNITPVMPRRDVAKVNESRTNINVSNYSAIPRRDVVRERVNEKSWVNLSEFYINITKTLEKQLNMMKESGTDVSKQVESVNALKTRVSAINEQTTREELKKIHSDLKALVKEIKELHQKSKRMMALNKFGGVLNKAEKLEKRLDVILENAKKNNKNTIALSSLIEEFKAHVAKAKEYQAEMMKMSDGMMKDMAEVMRKAHAELKEAHAVLIKIHQELKEKKIIGGGEA